MFCILKEGVGYSLLKKVILNTHFITKKGISMKQRLLPLYVSLVLSATGGSFLHASEGAVTRERVREHILQQLQSLDFMLENLGQALNNWRVRVKDRKASAAHLIKMRETLQELIRTNGAYSECSLLYRNRKLTDGIAATLESDFYVLEEPSYEIEEETVEEIDAESMEAELTHRDTRLSVLTDYSEHLGLSYLNIFSRSLSEFGRESGLTEGITRVLPYAGWGVFWHCLRKKDIPQVAPDATVRAAVQLHNGRLAPEGIAFLDSLPVVDLGLGLLFASTVKSDLKDLYGYSTDWFNWGIAQCKGELYDDGTGYRKGIMKFPDVIGAHGAKAELMSIVDYFKDKKAIDRIGASVDRAYLLTGPLDTSKGLAHAVAGEINVVLASQHKSAECTVYEVHASSLVNKSLKDVLKEAERRAPCIVVLEEIDCLHSYGLRKVKTTVWADILGTMNALARSKRDVFVITTASNDFFAEPEALARYGVFGKVENPTYEDRLHFFKRELEKRAVAAAPFDIEKLATRTEGYTFMHLANVLKRACAQAHSLRQSITQAMLEKAIDAKENRAPGLVLTTKAA